MSTSSQQRAFQLRSRIAELETLLTETRAELLHLAQPPAPRQRPLEPGDPCHTTGPMPSYGYIERTGETQALVRLRTTGAYVNVPLSNLAWGH